MKQKLIELLEKIDTEVYEQGSFADEKKYPDHFFTIWNDDVETIDHFDNKEIGYEWIFTINYYATNPLLPMKIIMEAKELLIDNGFIVPGKGNDVYSSSVDHSGRSIRAMYIEK